MCQCLAVTRLYSILILQGIGNLCFSKPREVDALCTTQNGRQNAFWFLTAKQEDGVLWWFFKQLQHFVGTCFMHLLWQPDDGHLELALHRLQAQGLGDFIALFSIDDSLSILCVHGFQPLTITEIRIGQKQFTPFGQVIGTDGLLFLLTAHDGEHEMHVWMH